MLVGLAKGFPEKWVASFLQELRFVLVEVRL